MYTKLRYYLLTPWCRVLLENLTGLQLVKKFPAFLWNPKVHYRTHKRPPPVPVLGQPNRVHVPTSHLLEIHPNIIHPSTPRSPQWSLSFRFPHQNPIRRPLLAHTRHMPSTSHSSRFYHPHKLRYYFISWQKTAPNETLRVHCSTQRSDAVLRRVRYIAKSDCYLHVRVEQLGSHWTDFHEVWYWNILRKSVQKIQVSLKPERVVATLHEDLCSFMIVSRGITRRMGNVLDKIVEKIRTHILCSVTLFSENPGVYDIIL